MAGSDTSNLCTLLGKGGGKAPSYKPQIRALATPHDFEVTPIDQNRTDETCREMLPIRKSRRLHNS